MYNAGKPIGKVIDNVYLIDSGISAVFDITNQEIVGIYLQYLRGTETALEMEMEVSTIHDTPNQEIWFKDSTLNVNTGKVYAQKYEFYEEGCFRIPIQTLLKEDKMRLIFKGIGSLSSPGRITVWGCAGTYRRA